ncbi:MAG: outer membrane beta-barrel protein [Burkholderiales bacterium]
MLNTIRVTVIALIGIALSSVAAAQGLDTSKLFFGAGASSNEVSGSDSAVGFQIFGGYGFGEVSPKVFIDAEVGYMDTGNMEKSGTGDVKANGLWATGVGRLMVTPGVELIGRLGLDFGDDDGLMAGIGVGFLLTKKIKLRLEYVQRDNVDSVQLNFVFQP